MHTSSLSRKLCLGLFTALLTGGFFLVNVHAQTNLIIAPTISLTKENNSGKITELQLTDLTNDKVYPVKLPFLPQSLGFTWGGGQFEFSWNLKDVFELVQADEDRPDGFSDPRMFSDIYVTPSTTSPYIYIHNLTAKQLKITLYQPAGQPDSGLSPMEATVTPTEVNLASGANFSRMGIVSRKQWGADESIATWAPEYYPVSKFIIHHTASSNTVTDYPGTVRSIFLYHTLTHGWGDIGYNYLIDPNGVIYEGRKGGDGSVGAHAYLWNKGSIGIAMIGDFRTATPTDAALVSLRKLIAEKAALHQVDVQWEQTMYGHRDMPDNYTTCPGDALYNILPLIAADAQQEKITNLADVKAKRDAANVAATGNTNNRVELTFNLPATTTATEVRKLIPANSAIDRVVNINGNKATIDVVSRWGQEDITQDRVALLYTIFSLDNNVTGINLIRSPRSLVGDILNAKH